MDYVFQIVIELLNSLTWMLNRSLLSIEKKRNYPQSKLTHRWFWPLSWGIQIIILVFMS